MIADRTIPEAYVLWHPGCQIGEALASSIYAWLRPGHGLGPDVFFRSLPRPGGGADPLPLPLPGEDRRYPPGTAPQADPNPKVTPRRAQVVTMQILVLLIDCNMVADASWRYWLEQLSATHKSGPTRVFLPVALDSTAFNIPSAIGRFNFLRPSGLPLPVNPTPAAVATVARSLCKQLTESLCRLLLGRLEGGKPDSADAPATVGLAPTKIAIFLSHAKKDGNKPARRIRDYIYAQTQLAAFFDENDIPFGTAFSQVIQSSVSGSHTAALIVILSAYYANRPWCRRELSTFRQPLPDPHHGHGHAPESWRLNPLLVVDALDAGSHTYGIPEVGNSPHIRWNEEQQDLEEQVVTLVLRDALLRAFHAALGRFIPPKSDGNRIVINWLPDPTTLLMSPRVRSATAELEVCYPGKGLSALELETLDRYFPHVDFKNYEQVLV
jgi:hypothetical protein